MRKHLLLLLALLPTLVFAQVLEPGIEGTLTDLTPAGVNITNTDAAGGGYGKVIIPFGTGLIFVGEDATNGEELWITDGTVAGTKLLKDINPGAESSSPNNFCVSGGKVYFSATTATDGNELWVTDGTTDGTVLVADIFFGISEDTGEPNNGNPEMMTDFNGKVLFKAVSPGSEGHSYLWISDGTYDGTNRVFNITPYGNSGAEGHEKYSFIQTTKDKAFFTAHYVTDSTPSYGEELWATDGTAEGTYLVLDIITEADTSGEFVGCDSCTASNKIVWLFAINDQQVMFNSQTPSIWYTDTASYVGWKSEPWISNGTPWGTYPLGDIQTSEYKDDPTQTSSSGAAYHCLYNGEVYFRANDPVYKNELHRITNEPGDFNMVYNIQGANSKGVEQTGYLNNNVVFDNMLFNRNNSNKPTGGYRFPDDSYPGKEIYGYDAVGDSVFVVDINPGEGHSTPKLLRVSNNRLYFHATVVSGETKLYTLKPRSEDPSYTPLAVFDEEGDASYHSLRDADGYLYFITTLADASQKLYRYDDGRTKSTAKDPFDRGPEPGEYYNRLVEVIDCDMECTQDSLCFDTCAVATCDDGIMNGDEEGIDCGGSCPATCDAPTCDDGIMNGDEEGVDCGGSCDNECDVTGINENEINSFINFHPNPAENNITIELTDVSSAYVRIYNQAGKAVWVGLVNNNQELDISNFTVGMYVVHTSTKDAYALKKLMIMR